LITEGIRSLRGLLALRKQFGELFLAKRGETFRLSRADCIAICVESHHSPHKKVTLQSECYFFVLITEGIRSLRGLLALRKQFGELFLAKRGETFRLSRADCIAICVESHHSPHKKLALQTECYFFVLITEGIRSLRGLLTLIKQPEWLFLVKRGETFRLSRADCVAICVESHHSPHKKVTLQSECYFFDNRGDSKPKRAFCVKKTVRGTVFSKKGRNL